ncbi:peptide/nickel transport system permease protein [Cryobacterium mesophilum]|uniref:ABC transporter permease n=1 Tax=Terrimesophilobacter mesophilus TaxID=433647 RepID=A0A4R8VEA4_9MICO|nr:ABC transporter permease [Terrimesophilobacter mesophilus]MBB5633821.1 peptide/nickel transport system permease protein [Terrimesophilobacter mesophilus]TFB80500.1 ABC transporter permease [Terrimesophilobacter mesophilus]
MSIINEGEPRPVVDAAEVRNITVGKSQGRLIFDRFVRNWVAMASLGVFLAVIVLSITSIGAFGIPGWWKWAYNDLGTGLLNGGAPTLSLVPQWLGGDGIHLGEHPFGQTLIGIDYFAMTMRGIQNSLIVMFIIGILCAVIGTVVGAVAGYYRGWVESVLMRFTDLVIVIPVIVLGAVVGKIASEHFKGLGVLGLSIVLGLFLWTGLARLVRGEFLTLREREYVDAARVSGARDARIMFRHILPNAVGVVIVSTTLIMAAAILLETGLSYLGFGIRSPDVSLGLIISQNQTAFSTRPYLFIWPGVFIVVIALTVNFIGDGLRDAFDPRQRKFVPRRMKERETAS